MSREYDIQLILQVLNTVGITSVRQPWFTILHTLQGLSDEQVCAVAVRVQGASGDAQVLREFADELERGQVPADIVDGAQPVKDPAEAAPVEAAESAPVEAAPVEAEDSAARLDNLKKARRK